MTEKPDTFQATFRYLVLGLLLWIVADVQHASPFHDLDNGRWEHDSLTWLGCWFLFIGFANEVLGWVNALLRWRLKRLARRVGEVS